MVTVQTEEISCLKPLPVLKVADYFKKLPIQSLTVRLHGVPGWARLPSCLPCDLGLFLPV